MKVGMVFSATSERSESYVAYLALAQLPSLLITPPSELVESFAYVPHFLADSSRYQSTFISADMAFSSPNHPNAMSQVSVYFVAVGCRQAGVMRDTCSTQLPW